jgi:hypothetical protein
LQICLSALMQQIRAYRDIRALRRFGHIPLN